MAVLFPITQPGQFLRPNQPAELLQGFLNIMNAENSRNGQLSRQQLDSYAQKQFFAPDPSSDVAGYLRQNFNAVAALDGNPNGISTNDLVQLRPNLPPVPPPTTNPPGGGLDSAFLNLMMNTMQTMLQLLTGLFSQLR